MGKKDKPEFLRAPAYRSQIHNARNMYVILYDTGTRQGWLVDGASALLHIVRSQVVSPPYGEDPCLFDIKQFHHADPHGGPDSAKHALLDPHNLALPIFEETESISRELTQPSSPSPPHEELHTKIKRYTFKDLVQQTWHLLEHMHDRQTLSRTTTTTTALKSPVAQPRLEGFDLTDLTRSTRTLHPRTTPLKSNGPTWLPLATALNALTLFARGYGNPLRPNPAGGTTTLCELWQALPPAHEYLAAPLSLLREICQKMGSVDGEEGGVELAEGVYWHAERRAWEIGRAHV